MNLIGIRSSSGKEFDNGGYDARSHDKLPVDRITQTLSWIWTRLIVPDSSIFETEKCVLRVPPRMKISRRWTFNGRRADVLTRPDTEGTDIFLETQGSSISDTLTQKYTHEKPMTDVWEAADAAHKNQKNYRRYQIFISVIFLRSTEVFIYRTR